MKRLTLRAIDRQISGEKLEIEVSKKGGTFKLAGNLVLIVEDGSFPKKTTIQSAVVPANKRQDFPLSLDYQEHLVSELIIVFSKVLSRKTMRFTLQSIQPTDRWCALLKCTNEKLEWSLGEKFEIQPNAISFSGIDWGMFAIVQRKPFDNIFVSTNGGLFYSVVHPLIAIRIPKKSSPIDQNCLLELLESNDKSVEALAGCYPGDLSMLTNIGSMFSFSYPLVQFKRPLTLRLPLPDWADDVELLPGDNTDTSIFENTKRQKQKRTSDMLVFMKREGAWEQLSVPVHYTQNTYSFDTKYLGTFVLVKPSCSSTGNREARIRQALVRYEHVNNVTKGMLLVFLWPEARTWYLWLELVPEHRLGEVRSQREEAGLIFIEQSESGFSKMDSCNLSTHARSGKGNEPSDRIQNRRFVKKLNSKFLNTPNVDCNRIVELSDGLSLTVSLSGDLQVKPVSLIPPIVSRHFHKTLMAVLNRQSQQKQQMLQLSQQYQPHQVEVEVDEEDEDDDFNFLSKVGVATQKKTGISASTNTDVVDGGDEDDDEDDATSVQLVYYSGMEDNFRIFEIEPTRNRDIKEVVIERVKQRIILTEDNKTTENLPVEINIQKEEENTNDSDDEVNAGESTLSVVSNIPNTFQIDNHLLRAHTPEAKWRSGHHLQLDVLELLFMSNIRVRINNSSLQTPPNQITAASEVEKGVMQMTIRPTSPSVATSTVKTYLKYRVFMEPEEMREYLNLPRPSPADVLATRHENTELRRNPYLREANITGVDPTVAANTRESALHNIVSKSGLGSPQIISHTVGTTTVTEKTKTSFKPAEIYKHPKVLSPKSLQALSLYVEQGLTLAVHLNIPDSVITGIGIDSISANLSLAEVSYKVFVHWKKNTNLDEKPFMLKHLMTGLQAINLDPIARLMAQCAEKNEELTKEKLQLNPEIQRLMKRQVQTNIVFSTEPDEEEISAMTEEQKNNSSIKNNSVRISKSSNSNIIISTSISIRNQLIKNRQARNLQTQNSPPKRNGRKIR